MAKDRVLRARVGDELAGQVDRFAEAHDTDVSAVVRMALRHFLDRDARRRRVERARRELDRLEATGVFDPPDDPNWKAGGFR